MQRPFPHWNWSGAHGGVSVGETAEKCLPPPSYRPVSVPPAREPPNRFYCLRATVFLNHETKNKKSAFVRAGGFSAVAMTTTEACIIFSISTATALPVFSQPSSSLWSEQSSSPSHLHDRRTQRPVPQRNWSGVHMDVAARHTHTRTHRLEMRSSETSEKRHRRKHSHK